MIQRISMSKRALGFLGVFLYWYDSIVWTKRTQEHFMIREDKMARVMFRKTFQVENKIPNWNHEWFPLIIRKTLLNL